MIMLFAIGKALLFVVAMAMEWLFTFGTHKVLNMPMFSKGSNNPLFNWTTASATNRDAHFIMATKAEEVVHIIGSISWAVLDLPSGMIELNTARGASEVVSVVYLAPVTQWLTVNNSMALMAHVVEQSIGLNTRVTGVAQCAPTVFNKACICQFYITFLTTEARWMPVGVHRFDHATNHKFAAFSATRSEQHLEIALAVFAAFKLVKNTLRKDTETLGTHKAVGMP